MLVGNRLAFFGSFSCLLSKSIKRSLKETSGLQAGREEMSIRNEEMPSRSEIKEMQ